MALGSRGLLDFRRGRGITVAGTPERGAVVDRVRERRAGFPRLVRSDEEIPVGRQQSSH